MESKPNRKPVVKQHATATGARPKEPPKVKQPAAVPPPPVVPAANPRSSTTVKSVMDLFYSSDALQKMYAERCVAAFSEFLKGNGPFPKAVNTLSDIADFVVMQRNFPLTTGRSLCEEFFLATFASLSTDKRKKKDKEVSQPDKVKESTPPAPKKLNAEPAKPGKIFPPPAKAGKANIRVQPFVTKFTEAVPTIPRFLEYFPHPRQQTFSSSGGLHPVSDCAVCAEFGFYNTVDALGKKRLLTIPQKIFIARIHTMVNSDGRAIGWDDFETYLDTKDPVPDNASSLPGPSAPSIDEAMAIDEIVIHHNPGETWADSERG